MLQRPLVVTAPHTRLTGRLQLVAHERQSYDIHLTLTAPPLGPGQPPQTSSGKFDLKDPYYRYGRTGHGVRQGTARSTTGVCCTGPPRGVIVQVQAAKCWRPLCAGQFCVGNNICMYIRWNWCPMCTDVHTATSYAYQCW